MWFYQFQNERLSGSGQHSNPSDAMEIVACPDDRAAIAEHGIQQRTNKVFEGEDSNNAARAARLYTADDIRNRSRTPATKVEVGTERRRSPLGTRSNKFEPTPVSGALRTGKSNIHRWGLFAMKPLDVGQCIMEYVGELVRSVLVDVREKKYAAEGITDTYFFRLDDHFVIDATKFGNSARFLNHSCNVSEFP